MAFGMNRVAQIVTVTVSCLTAIDQGLADGALTESRESPNANVRAVGLKEVRWTGGFWAERMATLQNRSIPAMWEIMKGNDYKPSRLESYKSPHRTFCIQPN